MTTEEHAQMQRWVDTWKKAGPLLERFREQEVRNADTWKSIEALNGLALQSIQDRPADSSSGLVEQQRWFRLLAANQNTSP